MMCRIGEGNGGLSSLCVWGGGGKREKPKCECVHVYVGQTNIFQKALKSSRLLHSKSRVLCFGYTPQDKQINCVYNCSTLGTAGPQPGCFTSLENVSTNNWRYDTECMSNSGHR